MKHANNRNGFSLIEALATVAIIGIITFLALPNVVRAREDAELNMAVARAEALNMAIASYVQSRGFDSAASSWASADDDAARYGLLANYLAYAPLTLDEFVPVGYGVVFPATGLTRPLKKVTLVIDSTPPVTIAY